MGYRDWETEECSFDQDAAKHRKWSTNKKFWLQMLEAVQVVHDTRIVHSDLKPANFLLVRDEVSQGMVGYDVRDPKKNSLNSSQDGSGGAKKDEEFRLEENTRTTAFSSSLKLIDFGLACEFSPGIPRA